MKKLLTTVVVAFVSIGAFGQGVVNFSNASSVPGWANPTFDRYVRWGAGLGPPFVAGDPVSSNYAGLNLASLRVALYYAASTDFDPGFPGFVQAAGGLATFKTSTSATAGSWFGGNRTLDTIGNGTTANLVVVVWDSSLSTDPMSPSAKAGRLWSVSSVFQYTPPTNPQAQPSDFLMTGFRGFAIDIPEPATFALFGLGAAAMLMGRRRR